MTEAPATPGSPPPPAPSDTVRMAQALSELRDVLAAVSLPLDTPAAEDQRRVRQEMVDQLEDYVVPRLRALDAPLLTVVGGSTGAGKSTLVNSLVARVVTEPGVLRPTTRSPVLVHHPDDAAWFGQDRLLPDLERVHRPTVDPGAVQLVAADAVPPGLAILDAPDIDSVEEQNRALASQLLAAADLWLFVTSAARYADQVPWDFLREAAERSAAVAIVLDRTPPEAVQVVSADLARMLAGRGLGGSPLFTMPEADVGEDGLLPAGDVADIRGWLAALAADAEARQAVVRQTLDGAVRTLTRRAHDLAEALAEQQVTARRLREDATAAYDGAVEAVAKACADGTLLRGEVLARWQEFVGTGELLKTLESRVGSIRDRLIGTVRGRPRQVERVSVAVESGLETLILDHAEAAAERAEASWLSLRPGQSLLRASGEDLGRASRDLRRRTERAVRDWQGDVMEMVRTQGADKRSTARFLAYGVNGLGVALMIVVFAHTGGVLLGAEAGVVGGAAILGQKLLEAVFGDQAVRDLAERARRDLLARVEDLFGAERDRYLDLLAGLAVDAGAGDRVRAAARQVETLRARPGWSSGPTPAVQETVPGSGW